MHACPAFRFRDQECRAHKTDALAILCVGMTVESDLQLKHVCDSELALDKHLHRMSSCKPDKGSNERHSHA